MDALVITVKARPGAPATRVTGPLALPAGPAWKIDVAAPPEKGKANAELVRFLAKALGVGRGAVEILSGETSHLKRVRIAGAAAEKVRALLGEPAHGVRAR